MQRLSSAFISKCLFFLLFAFALFPMAEAVSRCHAGPKGGGGTSVIHGHALTDPSPDDPATRHVVDFSVHLKHDTVIWDELSKDNIKIESCDFPGTVEEGTVRLSGDKLDQTDFKKGVVFAIEQADLEIGCAEELSPGPDADEADSYWFFEIKESQNIGGDTVLLTMANIAGEEAVPEVDIKVHEEKASEAAKEELKSFEFDDCLDSSRLAARNARLYPDFRNATGSLQLPTSDKLTLFKRREKIADNVHLEVSASLNAKISGFKLTRLSAIRFEWDQRLTASLSASLDAQASLDGSKRTGELARWFIPGLSFGLSIPFVGSIKAGAFVGVNWVTQVRGNVHMRLAFNAKYERYEHVRASLLPPRYDAENRLARPAASATSAVTVTSATSYFVSGFYGLRPVIGAGITRKKKKYAIKWRGFRTRIKRWTETTSVNGNLGVDVGLELYAKIQSEPFPAYTGSGGKIGICRNCHAFQGHVSFKGKSLGVQAVKDGKVTSERVFVNTLFNIRLGTVCALKMVCPLIPSHGPRKGSVASGSRQTVRHQTLTPQANSYESTRYLS